MSFYRLQDADRDAAELLNPDNHWSIDWAGGLTDPRHGVSVCWHMGVLIAYFARRAADGIGYDADFLATLVVIKLDGDASDEEDLDAAEGAELIIPTAVLSVRPLTDDEIAEILADAPVYA